MMRRWMKTIAGFAMVTAIAVAAYLFVTMRSVTVAVVQPETDVEIHVFGLGTVEARIVTKVGVEVGAALTELNVDHGDTVARGDVLARLNATQQEARVARAEAAALGADVSVQKAIANVERARAILAQRKAANLRKQALIESSAVSPQAAEEAKRDEDVAAAELKVALAEVEVARAQTADARAALAQETTILAYYRLTAPFDAVVVERHMEAGSVVKPGDVIFTLMAPESVWGLAYVDEARAGPIEEGQEAEVRLRSLPGSTFRARVVRIGIESDRVNEERRVWVKCEQCPPRVFLGEQAEVRIKVARLDRALLVPEAAVTGFDGLKGTVWVVRDGRLARAQVTFGHRTEDARLEIVDGLSEGDHVVAAVAPGLRVGRMATASQGDAR